METENGPKRVSGYLILNGTDKYLEHNNSTWFPYENPREAYVYTRDQVEAIKERAEKENWQIKPTHAIPATWQEGVGTILHETKIGKINKLRIEIGKLPPLKK